MQQFDYAVKLPAGIIEKRALVLSAPADWVSDAYYKSVPRYAESNVNEVQQFVRDKFKVDTGHMHDPMLIQNNAAWMPKKEALRLAKTIDRVAVWAAPGKTKVLQEAANKIRSSVRKDGLIITGSNYRKRGIVEHEFGHAISGSRRGGPLERFSHNRWVQSLSPLYHGIPTVLGGLGVGMGMGAGEIPAEIGIPGVMAAGVVTDAPSLYAEHAASRYAKDIMSKMTSKQDQPSLLPAFGTYVAGAAERGLIPSAAGAAVMLATRQKELSESPILKEVRRIKKLRGEPE